MSTSFAVARYAQAAKVDEGWVPKVYKDYKGFKTLGYGHLVTKESHKALTDLGVPRKRAQRILNGQGGQLTVREGESLLLKNVDRKEKELQFLLGKQKYQQLPTEKKVALLGLRFRGDFAKYNKKGVLSKEYKHAMTGRYNLAAKAIQKRVQNKGEPLGVRRRVQRHTEPLLLSGKKKPQAGPLALAVGAVAAGAIAALVLKKQKRKKHTLNSHVLNNNNHSVISSHALNNNYKSTKETVPKKKPCGPGKIRNPATGRCVKEKQKEQKKPCPQGKIRNPSTGRCKKIK